MRRGVHLFASVDAGKTPKLVPPPARAAASVADGHFASLPKALVNDIVSLLDGPSAAKLGMTCRRMRDVVKPARVWCALARAQEPHSSLVREDLVTKDFSWRRLYAWRRHVLGHCENGVDRIAVADQHRVLTCDPVAGGGASYVIHETSGSVPGSTLVPSLLTWSPRGELLAVVQDAPEGCKILIAAPPVTLRERGLKNRRKETQRDRRRSSRFGLGPTGDEDSTAAGYAVGASTFMEGAVEEDDGSQSVGDFALPNDADATRKSKRGEKRKHVTDLPRPKPKKKPSLAPLNELSLPVANPVFLAFDPSGTRLAVMSVQRRGREIALHELDCAVSLFSLYGGASGGAREQSHAMSNAAVENVKLLKASRELSFCYAPRSRDILALLDGTQVAKLAPVTRRNRSRHSSDELHDAAVSDSDSDLTSPHVSVGTRVMKTAGTKQTGNGFGWSGLFPFRAGTSAAHQSQTRGNPNPSPREDDDSHQEVTSLGTSLWWRVGGDFARSGVRVGLDSVARGMGWCAGFVGGGVGRGSASAAASRRRGGASRARGFVARTIFGGDQRAIKRARLTTKPKGGDSGRIAGDKLTGVGTEHRARENFFVDKHRGGHIPPRRFVPLETFGIPPFATEIDRGNVHGPGSGTVERSAGTTRHDTLHHAQVEGLLHIVQWIKPASVVAARFAGSDSGFRVPLDLSDVGGGVGLLKRTQLETQPTNPDGHWLVPASFQNAVPPSTFLALVPALATPGPAELRGAGLSQSPHTAFAHTRPDEGTVITSAHYPNCSAGLRVPCLRDTNPGYTHHDRLTLSALIVQGSFADRRETKRRKALGLPIPSELKGATGDARAAADLVAKKSKALFSSAALRKRIITELAPPATYQELHAVVPVVASASPGGRIVCWSDDGGLWARRCVGDTERNAGCSPSAFAVLNLQTVGFGAGAVDPVGTPNSDVAGGTSVLLHVAAMQWSASGRRLLILLVTHVATVSHIVPKYAWAVWDPPGEWLVDSQSQENENENNAFATIGAVSIGRWHTPSTAFVNDCLSIFEQYTQANTMWNPTETKVAYPVRREIAGGHENGGAGGGFVTEEIEIQWFPETRVWRETTGGEGFPNGDPHEGAPTTTQQQTDDPRALAFVEVPTEPPIVVCEGSFCAWSPR